MMGNQTRVKVRHQLVVQDVTVDGAALMPFPEDGLLKVKDVLMYVRVSQATWFDWVKQGIAPASRKIGFNTFWNARDVHQFIRGEVQK